MFTLSNVQSACLHIITRDYYVGTDVAIHYGIDPNAIFVIQ